MTPDINFVRHRPLIRLNLNPAKQVKEAVNQIGVIVSGAALVSAIAGYGALVLGRSVPAALALGTLGSMGAAVNERLKD
ncbi:hypothetical protein [Allocoleopsis franciscana]|uniref:Uncharacterized protein n=1 Tax=Allocoleopsis franciscana PCC 7113 TaxID=1173027 RepID=K9WR77_9CYAN|nr:hypothetical protein [Allocoleopsis franciscana]AFZ22289.1 hypothetical protein Mic7113_6727 [Allocoleopsis franciscana PCC 7113]